MARKERTYHQNFIDYQGFIISHPNYFGLPEMVSKEGKIKWVTTGGSTLGKNRKKWWEHKRKELEKAGVQIPSHAALSPVALLNHPTKEKACQTCGRIMSLEYVYPTKNTLNSINKLYKTEFKDEDYKTIFEIIESLDRLELNNFKKLELIFKGISTASDVHLAKEYIQKNFVSDFSKKLSPGAMSNCPDRLDGYHSYNKCCRSKEDTGRNPENLNKYGEDRRAYENWADGDWKAASWLMKEFNKHGVSADHIGPISLGFCHRPVFQPMSKSENSAKGNRMSFADFNRLIDDEAKGHTIVSWHTKPIWDRLKVHVTNQNEVYELCKYMRRNMHYVLTIFAHLKTKNLEDLLKSFLNPEHANFSISFEGFDPKTGQYLKITKKEGDKKQYSNNSARYIRIAFEQLEQYISKTNRKNAGLKEEELAKFADDVSLVLKTSGIVKAKEALVTIFDLLAEKAEEEFIKGNKLTQSLLDD